MRGRQESSRELLEERVMNLDAFVGGDDRDVGMTSSEDPLDRYRRDVERHLGKRLVLLEEESLERFFDHVIASFSRGVVPPQCARTWRRSPAAPSVRR
jgi:hypothetical protein